MPYGTGSVLSFCGLLNSATKASCIPTRRKRELRVWSWDSRLLSSIFVFTFWVSGFPTLGK